LSLIIFKYEKAGFAKHMIQMRMNIDDLSD